MTLLLGPPQSGKSTVLKALSGRLHPSGLDIQGSVSDAPAALVTRYRAGVKQQKKLHTSSDTLLIIHSHDLKTLTRLWQYLCPPSESPPHPYYPPLQVTYNGRTLDDFVVQRASTYIEQVDEHMAELTCALCTLWSHTMHF
jgi:hypothetical protein